MMPLDRIDLRALPGVRLVLGYRRYLWRHDLVAAVAVTALMIPHGMAYAELAGVPAVTGLYTTIAACFAYALFGPSRYLLLGPDSSLAPLIAAAVVLAVGSRDPSEAIGVAGVLALMTGGLCLLAGLSRLGTISELLSRPVELGYLNGLAVVMVVSQLDKLFGFSASGTTTFAELSDWVEGVADGATNGWALALGAGSVVLIVMLARRSASVPGVLVAVVITTTIVAVFDLGDRGVSTVGSLPEGFPTPSIPTVSTDTLWPLFLASIGLAWVTLTDTTALSRGFASRTGDRVDPNREIMALGAANIAAGVFSGFPVSASTSRTTTSHASGGRTQMVGIVAAVIIAALLLVGGDVVSPMPSSVLAAIVVAAAIKLFDPGQMRWLYRARRSEFVLSTAAMLGVVALGVLNGIALAVVLSLANFIRRVWRPYSAELARVDQRKGFHDVSRHPQAARVPGLVLFRYDSALFFANAEDFRRRLAEVIEARPDRVRRVVVAAEPITDIDTTAAAMSTT